MSTLLNSIADEQAVRNRVENEFKQTTAESKRQKCDYNLLLEKEVSHLLEFKKMMHNVNSILFKDAMNRENLDLRRHIMALKEQRKKLESSVTSEQSNNYSMQLTMASLENQKEQTDAQLSQLKKSHNEELVKISSCFEECAAQLSGETICK